jgi:ABC-2 type transport system permease protein
VTVLTPGSDLGVVQAPAPRAARVPGAWLIFRTAARLGWRIESNWADPFIFLIYAIAKPLAHAAILVVMYAIISKGNFDTPLFSYIYVGNAFYIYVTSVIVGVSWAVIEDRERYKTLKYIYVAPLSFPLYLVGRGVARFVTGTLSVALTLVLGVVILKLPIHPGTIDWPLFLLSLTLGLTVLAMMGLIIAGVTLLTAHHVEMMGEAVAGALYLLSGAVFPIDILPGWLRVAGYALPLTYWLELTRRALLGSRTAEASPALARFDNVQLLGILVAMAVLFSIAALIIFRMTDRSARERGLLDKTTNY